MLSNAGAFHQKQVIANHSDKKDEDNDSWDVDNNSLLCGIFFKIVETEDI